MVRGAVCDMQINPRPPEGEGGVRNVLTLTPRVTLEGPDTQVVELMPPPDPLSAPGQGLVWPTPRGEGSLNFLHHFYMSRHRNPCPQGAPTLIADTAPAL